MSTLEKKPTLREIFQSDNLCARCGKDEPSIFELFHPLAAPPEEATYLGFCSEKCYLAFCAAIKELSRAI